MATITYPAGRGMNVNRQIVISSDGVAPTNASPDISIINYARVQSVAPAQGKSFGTLIG